jgi:hypothetical protein
MGCCALSRFCCLLRPKNTFALRSSFAVLIDEVLRTAIAGAGVTGYVYISPFSASAEKNQREVPLFCIEIAAIDECDQSALLPPTLPLTLLE